MLEIKGLRLTLNGHPILRGINLEIKRGEIHTILGVNGAGKSSLAYCLMGSEGYRPQEGIIKFLGKEITDLSISQRAKLGLTLAWQESARFEGLSAREYLSLGMGNREDEERITQALNLVALDPKAFLNRAVDKTLSGGERRRLEIARALLTIPRFILLDEPFTGIDPLAILDLQDIILSLKNRGIGILITDHNVRDALKITDRAYIIDGGKILKEGAPQELVFCEEVKKSYLGENFTLS